eukprot:3008555-Pleurochrysis_carterae.AAC.2
MRVRAIESARARGAARARAKGGTRIEVRGRARVRANVYARARASAKARGKREGRVSEPDEGASASERARASLRTSKSRLRCWSSCSRRAASSCLPSSRRALSICLYSSTLVPAFLARACAHAPRRPRANPSSAARKKRGATGAEQTLRREV